MAATQLFPLEVWTSQITQASIPANENALRVEVLEGPALGISNVPAGGEAEGDMYVIGPAPSGDFASFTTGNVVRLIGSTWREFEAFQGWVKSIGPDVYVYKGGVDGWVVFAVGPTAEPWTYIGLAADFSENTATLTDIPGWSFPVQGDSIYEVEVLGAYQSTATTNGIGMAVTGPVDADFIGVGSIMTSATASAGFRQTGTDVNASTGVQTTNTNTPLQFQAIIKTGSTPGTATVQLRSEVNAQTTTLKAGLIRLAWRKLPL